MSSGRLSNSLFILGATFILVALGLVILASASQSFVSENYFLKQLLSLGIALICGIVAYFFDWQHFRNWSWQVLLGGVILLLLVFFPGLGVKVNGARRWISLGFFNLQVSELAKVAFVFFLADYLDKNQNYLNQFKVGFLVPLSILCLFSGLVFIEPDFGAAVLIALTGLSLLFLVGTRMLYLLTTVVSGGVLFLTATYFDPIRFGRILAFLNIEDNKFSSAYQLWQSLLGIASGGVWGIGLGNGRQQLYFLPEAHTDFIFPILTEELGILVGLFVVVTFASIFIFGCFRLLRPLDLFSFLFGMGILLLLTFQSLINLGVVSGILPTKGMALPFISYGGSNLVVMGIFLGILLSLFKDSGRGFRRRHR